MNLIFSSTNCFRKVLLNGKNNNNFKLDDIDKVYLNKL